MLVLKLFLLCVMMFAVSSDVMCTVRQWEAVKSTVVGTFEDGAPSVIASNTEISYDLNNSRIATTTYKTQDGQRIKLKNIYNYKQKILYAIKGDSCSKIMLNETFKQACTPQNSTESIMWYGMGYTDKPGQVLLSVYEFRAKVNGLTYITQTTWNGSPVFEHVHGVIDGASIFSDSAYLNMTWGIKNPDVFTPPLSCMGQDIQTNLDAIPKSFSPMTY